MEEKLDLILKKLGKIERELDQIKESSSFKVNLGASLLGDLIIESIKNSKNGNI